MWVAIEDPAAAATLVFLPPPLPLLPLARPAILLLPPRLLFSYFVFFLLLLRDAPNEGRRGTRFLTSPRRTVEERERKKK